MRQIASIAISLSELRYLKLVKNAKIQDVCLPPFLPRSFPQDLRNISECLVVLPTFPE